jgi:pimeloyl-ACP methyl ester carboxylesterase
VTSYGKYTSALLIFENLCQGLVFLQGGPGFAAGRPVSAESGWIKRALQDHRVFLLDQRGTGIYICIYTLLYYYNVCVCVCVCVCMCEMCVCVRACVCIGRSTAVTWESLEALGDADKQAEFMACMRADSIVRDCEAIRKTFAGARHEVDCARTVFWRLLYHVLFVPRARGAQAGDAHAEKYSV